MHTHAHPSQMCKGEKMQKYYIIILFLDRYVLYGLQPIINLQKPYLLDFSSSEVISIALRKEQNLSFIELEDKIFSFG